jgi:hypothetical protein
MGAYDTDNRRLNPPATLGACPSNVHLLRPSHSLVTMPITRAGS